MMYGTTLFLEMLPADLRARSCLGRRVSSRKRRRQNEPPSRVRHQCGHSDMGDWLGRADTNEKLMATGSTMVFYTMHLNYRDLFSQLKRHYPADTRRVVNYAGDPKQEKVVRSTVGRFLQEVDYQHLPEERHTTARGQVPEGRTKRKTFSYPAEECGAMREIDPISAEKRADEQCAAAALRNATALALRCSCRGGALPGRWRSYIVLARSAAPELPYRGDRHGSHEAPRFVQGCAMALGASGRAVPRPIPITRSILRSASPPADLDAR